MNILFLLTSPCYTKEITTVIPTKAEKNCRLSRVIHLPFARCSIEQYWRSYIRLVTVGIVGAGGGAHASGQLPRVVPRKRSQWQVVATKWVVGARCGVHTGRIIMGGESVWHSISGVAVQGEQCVVTMRVVGAERRVQSCRVLVGLRCNCGYDSKQQHLIKKTDNIFDYCSPVARNKV